MAESAEVLDEVCEGEAMTGLGEAEEGESGEDTADSNRRSFYKPPANKSLSTIVRQDDDDESLRKYKEALLGDNPLNVVLFEDDPRKVIVTKLALLPEGRERVDLDLSGDLSQLKNHCVTIKEGTTYRVRIYFYVQRDIVTGLKYEQKSLRKSIQVDKSVYMVGSYGPKTELQCYTTPEEDAPSGMIARGTYVIHSLFTDDDRAEHLRWQWGISIKKNWDDDE